MAERFHSLDSSLHSEGLTATTILANNVVPGAKTLSLEVHSSSKQIYGPRANKVLWTRSTRRKVAICWTRRHLCHRNSCQQSRRFNYNCHVEINHGKHSQPVKFEDILAQHFHVHTTPERFRDIHGRFSKGFAAAVVMLVFLEQSQADVVLNR